MFREGTAWLGADLLAAGNGSKRERLMTEIAGMNWSLKSLLLGDN